MLRTKTTYSLLIIDDGERVIDDRYDSDAERASALNDAALSNHDEIEEAAPTDVVAQGSQALKEWYEDDLMTLGIDIYLDEADEPVPAPQDLFHAVSSYSNGEALEVASYASEEARRAGLVTRAQDCEIDGLDLPDDASAEDAIEALEGWLPVEITLVDAHAYENRMEWYS